MKLSVHDQTELLARPDVLRQRIKEIESVFSVPGPTTSLLNSTTPILGHEAQMNPMTSGVMAHKYAR